MAPASRPSLGSAPRRRLWLAVGAGVAAGALALGAAGPAAAQVTTPVTPPTEVPAQPQGPSPFAGDGMWIWYVKRSSGGKPGAIVKRARRSGIETIYVKSGDATKVWGQFSSSLVGRLHAGGRKVCAWQFVYGRSPEAEARVGAAAKSKGADCLVIDAEGQYEGKYSAADRYMKTLRGLVGPDFPVALSSFPYVHFHPGFPYSVFLGPGGAQYNLPQLYWKTIGTTLSNGYEITYRHNNLYKRPIQPVGQTYLNPKPKQLKKFRRFARSYGSTGASWWSWQETSKKEWRAIRKGNSPLFSATPGYPLLRRGSGGDLVIWAQQHLVAASYTDAVGGTYGSTTEAAVASFQRDRGLPQTGQVDNLTWPALLAYQPATVDWSSRSSRAGGASAAARAMAPASASLPPRNEIPPGPGR
jgi:hypothetical protein